jgi:hypothetical protein
MSKCVDCGAEYPDNGPSLCVRMVPSFQGWSESICGGAVYASGKSSSSGETQGKED